MNFKKFFDEKLKAAARALAMKVSYGNYCGPSKPVIPPCDQHDDGSELLPAKNTLDSLCKVHDIDYCKCGSDWTSGVLGHRGSKCTQMADQDFVKKIKDSYGEMGRQEKAVAMMIYNYFRMHGSLQKILGNEE